MGSDMYMESQNFSPRPSWAEWQDSELVIFKDAPISGFHETWRGRPNLDDPTVVSLLKTMVNSIPAKPLNTHNELYRILTLFHSNDITIAESVANIKSLFESI